jgi:prepilin peptidase CpaA
MDFQAPLALLALATLVLTAVVCDLRTRRIPNTLVVAGIALGLSFQVVARMGGDLSVNPVGASGIGAALLGGLTGLALFLPLYVLRTMGAGDVKLLAMVGVWLGPEHVAWATLWTLLAGGVLALFAALFTGVFRQVLANLHTMVVVFFMQAQTGGGLGVAAPAQTTGRLPYAVAIGCGTAIELALVLIHSGVPTP